MAGFSVVERTAMMAPHPIGEIKFADCRVPADNMVGAEGDGFRLAMQTLDVFRASVGAAACGMARRALDEAVRYARRANNSAGCWPSINWCRRNSRTWLPSSMPRGCWSIARPT